MPELPEVETVVRTLRPYVAGKVLSDYRSLWPKTLLDTNETTFRRRVRGARILSVERRAKYIVLRTDRGFILLHLRMTGKLFPADSLPRDRHLLSAYFRLEDGRYIIFKDMRRFGRISYLPDDAAYERFSNRLGPEPLEPEFTYVWLRDSLRRRKRLMKPLLLDQAFLVGLGNIYVDEALFRAGIHPQSLGCDVPANRVRRLHRAIVEILRASIAVNGTTVIDFHFLGDIKGEYREQLRVFGRQGLPCVRCKEPLVKIRVAQRGTHICLRCQPLTVLGDK